LLRVAIFMNCGAVSAIIFFLLVAVVLRYLYQVLWMSVSVY